MLSVDPSAKSHSVLGPVAPTMSVEPCHEPKLKFSSRSAIPGPGKFTLTETSWFAPTAALTFTVVTWPATIAIVPMVWPLLVQ